MKISLIITVYKRLDKLFLVLEALKRQTFRNFEIIIAEDNDDQETKDFLSNYSKDGLIIQHVYQSDNDVQKTKILNKATVAAKGEYLIFIDGDCIPHYAFLSIYNSHFNKNRILYGRRVLLSAIITRQILREKNLDLINLKNLKKFKSKQIIEGLFFPYMPRLWQKKREIWGCNWGTSKENIMALNGFDEDYGRGGIGEDIDIQWRLEAQGRKLYSLKNKAIVYHLYHPVNFDKDNLKKVKAMLSAKQNAKKYFCKNGIKKEILQG